MGFIKERAGTEKQFEAGKHRRFWSWELWELILVEHQIQKTFNEGPAEPRTNRESEIERKAQQR